MFETVDPHEQLLARKWPLFMYGAYGLVGLLFIILGVRRHGFSQPFRLTVAAAMFVLSITWLATTLRSASPMTNRKFAVRNAILILLLLAHEIAYSFLM